MSEARLGKPGPGITSGKAGTAAAWIKGIEAWRRMADIEKIFDIFSTIEKSVWSTRLCTQRLYV